MGYKLKVLGWVRVSKGAHEWQELYWGQSWFKAIAVMISSKRSGIGCVRLEWRG